MYFMFLHVSLLFTRSVIIIIIIIIIVSLLLLLVLLQKCDKIRFLWLAFLIVLHNKKRYCQILKLWFVINILYSQTLCTHFHTCASLNPDLIFQIAVEIFHQLYHTKITSTLSFALSFSLCHASLFRVAVKLLPLCSAFSLSLCLDLSISVLVFGGSVSLHCRGSFILSSRMLGLLTSSLLLFLSLTLFQTPTPEAKVKQTPHQTLMCVC